jgi:hypothetical protein
VLFFSLAFSAVRPPIDRMAVNRPYRDIVADVAPGLGLQIIDVPPPNRDPKEEFITDGKYFAKFQDSLPEDSLYLYFRTSRNYNETIFHLVDHFAFALGRHFHSVEDLVSGRLPVPGRLASRTRPAARVLIHFDAGWALKVYPRRHLETLIDLLRARDCQVTILAGANFSHSKAEVTTFKDYHSFKELMQNHDILVGMDSFPSHFAAHVVGLPTVCLFSSTRPENSDAPSAKHYVVLEKGLECRPCCYATYCHRYDRDECANFVEPEAVVATVERMLAATAGGSTAAAVSVPTRRRETSVSGGSGEVARPIKTIRLRYVRFQMLMWRLSPAHSKTARWLEAVYRIYRTQGWRAIRRIAIGKLKRMLA